MDAKRAQEIADSPKMANVTYNGNRVYIEHVDQGSNTATVHPLNDPSSKLSVEITNLHERQ